MATTLGASLCLGTLAWATPAQAAGNDVIPLRHEAQALGWEVAYDDATRRVDLKKGDTQAAVWLDSRTGYRNAQSYTLEAPVKASTEGRLGRHRPQHRLRLLRLVDRSELQPGDLVFFDVYGTGAVSHVGIYVGDDEFISAIDPYGIQKRSLNATYWAPKYAGARRI